VGLHELALIWDLGMREFPPRLPHQPIFYPVINADYARQIARDWNTRDANSGFAGFVAEFAFDNAYIAKFAPHVAGASQHQECWIPSEELSAFNKSITGRIRMQEGFFGAGFIGHVPDAYGFKGKRRHYPIIDIGKNLGLQHFRRGVRDFCQPKVRIPELSILGAPRLFRIRRQSSTTRRFHLEPKKTLGVQSR